MDYIEYDFKVNPKEPNSDVLIAFLSELGFDTFIDSEEGFITYIPEGKSADRLETVIQKPIFDQVSITYATQKVEDRNWNEEWERDFEPIWVEDEIYIKADFHPNKKAKNTIHIQPKMAFGTGHHETTYLMLQMMREMDFEDKKVLDMGAGTAVLAIYAKQRGASYVEAIDIDEWAYENAQENAERNQVELTIKKGDKSELGSRSFDVILANINKNILLNDIPTYVENLRNKGQLLLSGILETDFADIDSVCTSNGLIFEKKIQKNEWISTLYTKP